jgi:hypothetical protein
MFMKSTSNIACKIVNRNKDNLARFQHLWAKPDLSAYQNYIRMVKYILHSFDTKLLNNYLAVPKDHKNWLDRQTQTTQLRVQFAHFIIVSYRNNR